MLKRHIGDIGEELAVRYLKKRGYKIVERNFLTKYGEIDIIARDGDEYVFCEVKLRKNDAFGGGAYAVTPAKIKRLKRTAECYMIKENIASPVRFDVIHITGDGEKEKLGKENLCHITNAF